MDWFCSSYNTNRLKGDLADFIIVLLYRYHIPQQLAVFQNSSSIPFFFPR